MMQINHGLRMFARVVLQDNTCVAAVVYAYDVRRGQEELHKQKLVPIC